MWANLGKLVLFLFLPHILSKAVGIIKTILNWRSHVVFFGKKSWFEKISLAVLAGLLVNLFCSIGNPEQLYFAITRTNIDSPAYLIRNRFRDYVKDRESVDIVFREMMSLRRSVVKDSLDREVLQKVHTPFVSLEEEYIKLELLSMDLRVNENRQKYVLFGPDGMHNEVFDGTTLSRAGLIAPSVLKDYLLSLFVAGLVTVSTRKYRWRSLVLVVCALALTYESYEWLFSDNFNIELYSSSPSENYLTRPEQIALVRNVILLVTLLVVFVVDLPIKDSATLQSLKAATENVEVSASKLQASRLARMATMGDDTLRKHAWDFYRKAANEKQHIFNDPEYKKTHADLARKYNLEGLMQKADETINGTFNIMFDNTQGK